MHSKTSDRIDLTVQLFDPDLVLLTAAVEVGSLETLQPPKAKYLGTGRIPSGPAITAIVT